MEGLSLWRRVYKCTGVFRQLYSKFIAGGTASQPEMSERISDKNERAIIIKFGCSELIYSSSKHDVIIEKKDMMFFMLR